MKKTMKWCVIDSRKDGNGDVHQTAYESKEQAVSNACIDWNHLTKSEKKAREIVVGLCEEIYDEDLEESYLDLNVWEYAWHSGIEGAPAEED